jgi:hypothetical protein
MSLPISKRWDVTYQKAFPDIMLRALIGWDERDEWTSEDPAQTLMDASTASFYQNLGIPQR